MDSNSMNESVQKALHSPPRRRRSTFFEKRESIAPQLLTNLSNCRENEEHEKRNREDLAQYCEKLMSEKNQWKKEATERKNKYHDLKQQFKMAVSEPSRSRASYAALTTEDVQYIQAKVNTQKIVDMTLKLHDSMKETMALTRRVNELDDFVLSHCKKKVDAVKDYILENSMVD